MQNTTQSSSTLSAFVGKLTDFTRNPYAIHVGADGDLLARFEAQARAADMSVIRLDLTAVSSRANLAEYLSEAFMFPHETRGLDAAVDLISDLEWWDTVEPFASILPNIIDRWRSQGQPFIVVIRGTPDLLSSALATANRKMDEAGSSPWAQPGTGAVEVVVHNKDEFGHQG